MTSKDIKVTKIDDNHVSISAKVECDIGTFKVKIKKAIFDYFDCDNGEFILRGKIINDDLEDPNSTSIIVKVID